MGCVCVCVCVLGRCAMYLSCIHHRGVARTHTHTHTHWDWQMALYLSSSHCWPISLCVRSVYACGSWWWSVSTPYRQKQTHTHTHASCAGRCWCGLWGYELLIIEWHIVHDGLQPLFPGESAAFLPFPLPLSLSTSCCVCANYGDSEYVLLAMWSWPLCHCLDVLM